MPKAPEPAKLASQKRFEVPNTSVDEAFDNLSHTAALACDMPISLSEARFRALSEVSPMGIYATDIHGTCVYTNSKWLAICDMSEAHSLGAHWTACIHPQDKVAVVAHWQACIDAGLPFTMDFRLQQPAGTLRVVHCSATQTLDHAGICTGFVGTFEDITKREASRHNSESLLAVVTRHRLVSFTDLNGVITDANDGFCKISGYSRDELIGQNHRIVNSGKHPAAFFEAMWRKLTRGESWKGEICNRAKNGNLYWVDSVIAPMRGADGAIDGYISIRNDITRQKAQTEELRKSQANLERVARMAGVGGWEVDIVAGTVYWSDETCRIHDVEPGFTPELDTAINFYAPEARPIIQQAVERGMSHGTGWDLELPLITATGRQIWVRAIGNVEFEDNKPRRIVGAFQDITTAYQQRQEIVAIKNRFQLATSSGGVGVWELDLVSGSLTWSPEMYLLYGLLPSETTEVYELWTRHLHPEDKAKSEAELQGAIAGTGTFQPEFRVIWSDGSIHFIKAAAMVERDKDGKPLRMIGTNWDITGVKLAEQAKTEFVSTVSHELRTPLTSISGALGLAINGALGEVPPKMSAMLQIAYRNSQRLTHLINDLLDIEKLAAGRFSFDLKVMSLMPLIEECLVSTQSYAEEYKVNFVIGQRADDVQVRVDGSRIQQVMANFLSNAAKFSPAGAQVTINIIQRGQLVRVEVKDRGAGIPEEFRKRIFQKFSQADSSATRQKGGTGLGLAISKELIDRMNGSVGFHSAPGQGACFHFELPVWQASEQAGNTNLPAAAYDAPGILVVEDEPDIASLLATILGNAGYRVDVAENAATASHLLAVRHYAAVCLDLMLPDRNGLSVVREIRSTPKTATLPVIIVSAYNDEGKLAIAGQCIALDWIEKPFDSQRLLTAIKSAVLQLPAIELATKPRVLHIEDDEDFVSVFAELCQHLADIDHAHNLAEARRCLALQTYQAIVLDLNLPDGNGIELLPDLKVLTTQPPVIVLSGSEAPEALRQHIHMAMTKSGDSTQPLLEIMVKLVGP